MKCRLVDTGWRDGFYNMSVDEALLLSGAGEGGPPVLRFYGWSPAAVSLGYFQREEDFRSMPGLKGIDIVRRLTGGGAILHDDEVTFSVVCGEKGGFLPGDVPGSYEKVCEALVSGLGALGIRARRRGRSFPANPVAGGQRTQPFFCFETPSRFDIEAGGKKLAGSAQRRGMGGVLHHGSVPLSCPGAEGCIGAGAAAGREISFSELRNSLIIGFEKVLGAEFFEAGLSSREEELAGELARTKYRRPGRR